MTQPHSIINLFSRTERGLFFLFLVLGLTGFVGIVLIFISHFTYHSPKYGGTYTEGIIGSPVVPNPILATTDTDQSLSHLMYSGLLTRTSWNTYESNLGECSPDTAKNNVVCSINSNARFHDGESVSADDVVFTVETIQKLGSRSPYASLFTGITVTKTDQRTVRFNLPQSFSGFDEALTVGILPKHIWGDIPANQIENYALNPDYMIGSGSYMFISSSSDAGKISSITLGAFDDGHTRPYIAKLQFKFYSSREELLFAFKAKNLDGFVLDSNDTELLTDLTGTTRIPIVHADIYGVFIKSTNTQLKSILGQLNTSINRESLVAYGIPWDQPLPPWNSQALVEVTEKYDTINPLRQTAVTVNPSIAETSGTPSVLVTIDQEPLVELSKLVQSQLLSIGTPTELRVYDFSGFKNMIIPERKFNFLVFGTRYRHSSDSYAYWNSSERRDPGLNITETASSQIDSLSKQLTVYGKSESDYQTMYSKLNGLLSSQQVFLPLYLNRDIYVFQKGKKPFTSDIIYNATPERWNTVSSWYTETYPTLSFTRNDS